MSDERRELARRLEAAGLPAGEADLELLGTIYPLMREAVAMLHALPAAAEEIPALRFEADPDPVGWHDQKGKE